jgi:hypothetical protein
MELNVLLVVAAESQDRLLPERFCSLRKPEKAARRL